MILIKTVKLVKKKLHHALIDCRLIDMDVYLIILLQYQLSEILGDLLLIHREKPCKQDTTLQ
jgi:hypothetical protein